MFSGIVQGCAKVAEVKSKPWLISFALDFPEKLSKDLKKGSSISVCGVCLTTTNISGNKIFFDAMKETLNKTTIGSLKVGDKVNIERALRIGDEIGGHDVSGHVDTVAKIAKVEKPKNNHIVTFQCDKRWMKYIFPKGFVALDGVSLTVVDVDKTRGAFSVYFIPETLKITTFGSKTVGDSVNLEIDRGTQVIVETMENILSTKKLI
ncbi:MAG: riboflavin synthase subunit alpha [Candidatus Aenigmarchaeota archaeon]|nr:riboflavin synthase subunit alpha [Candidatus Aenigmarchaeota archaeon]